MRHFHNFMLKNSRFLYTLAVCHHCFWINLFAVLTVTLTMSSLRWPTRDTQQTKKVRFKTKTNAANKKGNLRKQKGKNRKEKMRRHWTLVSAAIYGIWRYMPAKIRYFLFKFFLLRWRFYVTVLQCDFVGTTREIWIPILITLTFYLLCLRFSIRVSQCDIEVSKFPSVTVTLHILISTNVIHAGELLNLIVTLWTLM